LTTVPIWTEKKNGERSSGTSFVFAIKDPQNTTRSLPVMVTNKHVVEGADHGVIDLSVQGGGNQIRPDRIRVGIEDVQRSFILDEKLDLAAAPLGPVLNQLKNSGREPLIKFISDEMIPSEALLNELGAIEQIIFIGYPSGIYDEKNASPLVRQGITSSPIFNDFEGAPVFLIDAGVFPGSSGSPVFLFNQGIFTSRQGAVIGNRLMFLGILTESYIREERVGARTYLGLGRVIKSGYVRDFLTRVYDTLTKRAKKD
jgi:hypothetical protein